MASAAPRINLLCLQRMWRNREEEVPLRRKRQGKGSYGLIWISLLSFSMQRAQARKRFEEEQASERLVQQLQAADLAQEDLPNVSEERAKELDDLMMRMTETDWLNLMMQVGSNPALARELLGADVTEENFIERMTAVKERKKRALADLRYRALKGKPLKKSEVTQLMRNLVKNQWCAAHNGTITMKEVKALNQKQLVEEYEYICRRLEKDRLLSAQYNLFRPKPDITEPPSKRQRVERASSQPASVPAATTHTADDPDSAGGGSSNPAGSAFGAPVTDPTVSTSAAMDSAGSHREIGVSPFADSAASSSPSNVSTDHIPIDVLFASTSGGIHDFFLESDEEEQIGLSRVAADPDSDDEVLAEIIFRGEFQDWEIGEWTAGNSYIHVLLQQNRRPEILRLKSRLTHWFREPLGDVNMLCQSLHSAVVEWIFWRTQDVGFVVAEVVSQELCYVMDLTELGRMCICLWSNYIPIRRISAEGLLRHRLTVPPSYCRDVVVAGNIIQTIQTGLRQSFECLASAPIACTARQMVFSSPWLTAKKESGSPLQTALVCNSNPLIALASPEQMATGKDMSNPLYGCDGLPKTVRVFQFTLDSCSEKLDWFLLHQDWRLLFFDVATSFDSAVFHLMLLFWMLLLWFLLLILLLLVIFADYFVFCCSSILLLREDLSRNLELTESTPNLEAVPADYVPAGHVLISADRYRIC
ncbi:hypothetical protein Tco_0206831 [Tanacetum coccineum]